MLISVVFGLAALVAVNADCKIDVNQDLPKAKSPLFLTGDTFLLPQPEGKTGVLKFPANAAINLACPGNKNALSQTKAAISEVKCASGNKFKVGSKNVELKDLSCDKTVSSILKVTSESCANNGTRVELGFELKTWHPLVELCHQIELGNTLYAKHTIHGANLDGAEVETKRPSFTQGDRQLYKGYSPDALYKQSSHKAMLEKALGKATTNKLMDNSFIARGHLAPDADFVYGSWSWLTYFYANAAPQWQAFNAGNWLAVEKLARKKASQIGGDLTVYTGTQGILTLPNTKGVPVALYLEPTNSKLPVPEWYWKVIYNPKNEEAIALVGSNNPLLENANNLLCPNVCEANGWNTMPDFKKGYVYCCTVDSLRKAVPYLPAFRVRGTMRGL